MLLSTGEQISCSLCAMAIEALGYPVISLTGGQAGFETSRAYGNARIKHIQTDRINMELDKRAIVIVTGFQGVNRYDDITTRHTTEQSGDIFNGNDVMAGLKWTSWEGGTRLPYIARWPGHISPGTTDHMIANYDFMPTLSDLIGQETPGGKDGESFLPTLLVNS